ncbi:MAG: GPW/gp25 family protein [Hyphomicrobiales bacterium]|nr:GPW/gp25 family protein [Hyphomicrobiales bacterium]MDE2113825.1 GPW/gp25 family protein [Hyphomicrobiales bacterium]
MARIGIHRVTGEVLTGWAHCAQSIGIILTTAIGSLIMARDFGADVPSLIDAPASARVVLALMSATAQALAKDEPGFKLTKVQILSLDGTGLAQFTLAGVFYPNGHLGDYSVSSQVSASVPVTLQAFGARAAVRGGL